MQKLEAKRLQQNAQPQLTLVFFYVTTSSTMPVGRICVRFDLRNSLAGIPHVVLMISLWSGVRYEGMVLLELITRKKIGENGFARRTPAKLFALEAEEVRQESPPDAPDSLLNLAAM